MTHYHRNLCHFLTFAFFAATIFLFKHVAVVNGRTILLFALNESVLKIKWKQNNNKKKTNQNHSKNIENSVAICVNNCENTNHRKWCERLDDRSAFTFIFALKKSAIWADKFASWSTWYWINSCPLHTTNIWSQCNHNMRTCSYLQCIYIEIPFNYRKVTRTTTTYTTLSLNVWFIVCSSFSFVPYTKYYQCNEKKKRHCSTTTTKKKNENQTDCIRFSIGLHWHSRVLFFDCVPLLSNRLYSIFRLLWAK